MLSIRHHRVKPTTAAGFLILIFVCGFFAKTGLAIPQFAKKYGQSCQSCHSAVPKLNAFGERFRANGYQLPGTIERAPIWQQEQLPLSGMPHPMWMQRRITNRMAIPTPNGIPPGETIEINSTRGAFEFFSGGTVGPHLSYLTFLEIEIEPEIEGEVDFSAMPPEVEEPAGIETETEIAFHQFFVMYNNLLNVWGDNIGNLNLRVGIFHLETPYSPLRKLTTEMSPYLVYELAPVKGGFRLGRPQMGASAFGWLGSMRFGLEYELAVVNGTNDALDTNAKKDFYGRLAARWLERVRVGGLVYRGSQNIGSESSLEQSNEDFYRLGIDLDLTLPRSVNVYGQWMYGKDDDVDGGFDGQQSFEWDGFFIGADIPLAAFNRRSSFLKRWWVIARYDEFSTRSQWRHSDPGTEAMIRKSTGDQDRIRQYTVALRHYFMPNVFLVMEHGWRDNDLGYPALDVAFGGGGSGAAGRIVDVDSRWTMVMAVLDF